MRRSGLLAAVSVLLLPAAPAAAALPTFEGTKIEPGRSIGGVRIGMTHGAAVKIWGQGERPAFGGPCGGEPPITDPFFVCSYRDGNAPRAGYSAENRGTIRPEGGIDGSPSPIVGIAVSAQDALGEGPPRYRGPVMKLRTSKGIGLKSTLAKVRKAYPRGKVSKDADTGKVLAVTVGSGARKTTFSGFKGRVASITVGGMTGLY